MADREEGTMPEGMLERIEIAIRDKVAEIYGTIAVNGGTELALAAVEAMRGPSPSMMEAAGRETGYEETALVIWQAMITAILEGK